MQALVGKLTLFSSTQKKLHYLPAYSTVFPFPDVSGFMDMQFILIDLYSLIFLHTSVSILAALGEKREGGGGCLTVDTVTLSVLKHFNKRLALQRVNLWRYTYSYYQNEQSLYIYKHVHAGILNVIYIAPKKFKSWNKCFWINDSKVHLWRCGILHHAIKVWKRYGLDTYQNNVHQFLVFFASIIRPSCNLVAEGICSIMNWVYMGMLV